MSEPFIAEIVMFAGNFAPRGWAFCDGQLLAVSQNDALFSLLGTIYGGDGRTTFGLPDLRGRAPMHAGNGPGLSPRREGQRGGGATVTYTAQNLPAHNHPGTTTEVTLVPNAVTGGVTSDEPGGKHFGSSNAFAGNSSLFSNTANASLAEEDLSLSTTLGNTGAQQAADNMAPYLAIRFIIALTGIYPSRS